MEASHQQLEHLSLLYCERTLMPIEKVLTIASNCAGLIGAATAIYSVLFFVPNFLKQKKIEQGRGNAEKSLDLLSEVEEAFKKIKSAVSNQEDASAQEQARITAYRTVKKFRKSLLLLREHPQVDEMIRWNEDIIKKLKHTEGKGLINPALMQEITQENNPQDIPEFKKLEEFEEALLKIYEMPYENYPHHH